ncbi:MAG: ABC transporter ATP-binding protein [Anaerolineae bacterium]
MRRLTRRFELRRDLWSRLRGRAEEFLLAVDEVSFSIPQHSTFALVGESGCGKSTTGRCILRLIEPSDGEIIYRGENILLRDAESMRSLRRKMQVIFQDPYSSLNPRMTAGQILGEVLSFHRIGASPKERRERIEQLMLQVGLNRQHIDRYPHEFSGGQRQRVGIARALAVEPEFIVADEPVSALDVSVQAQIINLLVDLQSEFGLTYLFIAHDLSVVKHISDVVAVMYLGRLVEQAPTEELFANPLHPYTRALLSAIPRPDPRAKRERTILQGELPSLIGRFPGCHFHTRCRFAMPICKSERPPWKHHEGKHYISCWLYNL